MRIKSLFAAVALTLGTWTSPVTAQDPPQRPTPTFRAAADLTSVTVVVRRRNGQPVTDLRREDFELVDSGHVRPIVQFRSEATPITVALLVDLSGSMGLAKKMDSVRLVVESVLAQLTPGEDQVGLLAFDTSVRELVPFGPAPGRVLSALNQVQPFGSTSLFDAVADAGAMLAERGSVRRAVVAITDGGDNASRMTPTQVTNLASEIDVPVYVVVVGSPLDRAAATTAEDRAAYRMLMSGKLGSLSYWTGGELTLAADPEQAAATARQIVTELRHQYMIGIEPDTRPGWHPIEVHTRQTDLVVRARSGYMVRGGNP